MHKEYTRERIIESIEYWENKQTNAIEKYYHHKNQTDIEQQKWREASDNIIELTKMLK